MSSRSVVETSNGLGNGTTDVLAVPTADVVSLAWWILKPMLECAARVTIARAAGLAGK